MRKDMRDLTVLIPVRIESLARLENLLAVVGYLGENFDLGVMVLEASARNSNILPRLLPASVDYTFVQDDDPVFYRTRYINRMALAARTEYLAVWDADVVFPVSQVCSALEMLRSGKADFAYPYDGVFLDTSELIRQMFLETGDVGMLGELRPYMTSPYGSEMRGGAFLANRQAYIASGMENERFYGWSPEDWERYERWANLGLRVEAVDGVLFHLTHPRDMNGRYNSDGQMKVTVTEKDRIRFSSAEEIRQHLNLKS